VASAIRAPSLNTTITRRTAIYQHDEEARSSSQSLTGKRVLFCASCRRRRRGPTPPQRRTLFYAEACPPPPDMPPFTAMTSPEELRHVRRRLGEVPLTLMSPKRSSRAGGYQKRGDAHNGTICLLQNGAYVAAAVLRHRIAQRDGSPSPSSARQ
jgi:hypothetical protein